MVYQFVKLVELVAEHRSEHHLTRATDEDCARLAQLYLSVLDKPLPRPEDMIGPDEAMVIWTAWQLSLRWGRRTYNGQTARPDQKQTMLLTPERQSVLLITASKQLQHWGDQLYTYTGKPFGQWAHAHIVIYPPWDVYTISGRAGFIDLNTGRQTDPPEHEDVWESNCLYLHSLFNNKHNEYGCNHEVQDHAAGQGSLATQVDGT